MLKGTNIKYPVDIRKFLFDYKHSKFIECNKEYAKQTGEYFSKNNHVSDSKRFLNAKHGLIYVTSALEEMEKNYWLAAGTLLGKIF